MVLENLCDCDRYSRVAVAILFVCWSPSLALRELAWIEAFGTSSHVLGHELVRCVLKDTVTKRALEDVAHFLGVSATLTDMAIHSEYHSKFRIVICV